MCVDSCATSHIDLRIKHDEWYQRADVEFLISICQVLHEMIIIISRPITSARRLLRSIELSTRS